MKTKRTNITLKTAAQVNIIELRRANPKLEGTVSVIDHALMVARVLATTMPNVYQLILEQEAPDGDN